jgi:mRNA-degrading endonuclease YafQ of YafQ-DinJ toxin-antitoxin module
MTTFNDSDSSIFSSVIRQLREIYDLAEAEKSDVGEILERVGAAVQDLELIHGRHSAKATVLWVERAFIIGHICLWVKDSLLHGQWTEWAAETFTESLRTLEKFMAIAKSAFARDFAQLGTEKVYQLTRVEHLLNEDVTLPDLFQDCGLDGNFANYTGKGFERAVTVILNKAVFCEHDIELSNESLHKLSGSFNLMKDNRNVLGRLCEAKSEDADLEKTVANVIASAGGRTSVKRQKKTKAIREDVNAVAERFIRSLQEAMENPNSRADENRLKFVVKLIAEYLALKSSN